MPSKRRSKSIRRKLSKKQKLDANASSDKDEEKMQNNSNLESKCDEKDSEIAGLKLELTKMKAILENIAKENECMICFENRTDLRLICQNGHMICSDCFTLQDDIVGKLPTAEQRRASRVCPTCRTIIMGQGFKVLPVFNTNAIINEFKNDPDKNIQYDNFTPNRSYLHALQLSCFSHLILAKETVKIMYTSIPKEYFDKSFIITLNPNITKTYFDEFMRLISEKNRIIFTARTRSMIIQSKTENNEKNEDNSSDKGLGTPKLLVVSMIAAGRFSAYVLNTNLRFPSSPLYSVPNLCNNNNLVKIGSDEIGSILPVVLINDNEEFLTKESLNL